MELTGRQEEILDAAMHIIATDGLRALSTRHLAERVGITEPTIYRHFRTKQELIQQLIRRVKESFGALLLSISRPTLKALDNILYMLDQVFQYLEENCISSNTILSLSGAGDEPALDKELAQIANLGESLAEQQLQRGVEDGSIRRDIPVPQLGFLVLSMILVHIQKWKSSGNAYNLKDSWRLNAEMLRKLLSGE
jgi:TetR/AcrR family fatty acid metabolism transcriptional regulator